MSWHRVADFAAESDLSQLHHWLQAQRYPHRFSIEGDRQVLWSPAPELVGPLRQAARDLQEGRVIETAPPPTVPGYAMPLPSYYAPVTLVTLLLGFAGSALLGLGDEMIRWFTFYDHLSPFYRNRGPFSDVLDGHWWRIITPIFLHFGFLHIAFNAMWLWYLGSRLEQTLGSLHLLILILVIGLTSNISQALVSYPIAFGGLSGVVFGLLGYFWITGKLRPHPYLFMPPGLFPIMLALMLISVFGAFDWMSGAEVADTAHISGLLSGLLCGLAYHSLRPSR